MRNRQKLLWLSALLVLLAAGIGIAAMQKHDSVLTPVTQEEFMFDTFLNISIYDGGKDNQLNSIFQQVYSRSREIEVEFSVFQEDSLAQQINREAAKQPVPINEDFSRVLQTAMEVSQWSGGAFDITVKPLSDLWNFQSPSPSVPDEEEIDRARACVGYQNIEISDRTIRFRSSGTQIEFGAVAKGFAVQEAADQLRELGVEKAIVNYGGNVALVGEKKEGTSFSVGIQTPFGAAGEYFALLSLSDCALATSGAYERNFTEDGVLYHHILDPKTGYPAESGLKSVTVVCEDASRADALSTAFFVMGLERSLEAVNELEGVEAVLVDEENFIYVTDGLIDQITIVDDTFRLKQEE